MLFFFFGVCIAFGVGCDKVSSHAAVFIEQVIFGSHLSYLLCSFILKVANDTFTLL